MTWQYNGVAPWDTVVSWCYAHLGKDWYSNGHETLVFESEAAYAWFMLRWS